VITPAVSEIGRLTFDARRGRFDLATM